MTVSTVRKIPTELPHARIYVDDLFEIEDLLREEYSNLPEAPQISFEYVIEKNIVITTREELIEHGGYACDFSLRVVGASTILTSEEVLMFYEIINPRFTVPYMLRGNRWAIFGRVEQTFISRKDRLKTFADSVPVRLSLWYLAVSVSLGIINGLVWSLSKSVLVRSSSAVPLLGVGVYGIMMGSLSIASLRRNRVNFARIRQDQKAKLAIRNERIEKLIWMLLGVVLGVAGTILTWKMKR